MMMTTSVINWLGVSTCCLWPWIFFWLVWHVASTSSAEEITAINNSMEILKGNEDILSKQIKQTFNFVSLTYVETDTNRLLLKPLQKDVVQINSTVHHLSKELKVLIYNRKCFYHYVPAEKASINSLQWNTFSQNSHQY